MTIGELVLALKAAAEKGEFGLNTPVFCEPPGSGEVLAISKVDGDDECECMISLA